MPDHFQSDGDGFTYDKYAIQEWIDNQITKGFPITSLLTGQVIGSQMIQNRAINSQIQSWLAANEAPGKSSPPSVSHLEASENRPALPLVQKKEKKKENSGKIAALPEIPAAQKGWLDTLLRQGFDDGLALKAVRQSRVSSIDQAISGLLHLRNRNAKVVESSSARRKNSHSKVQRLRSCPCCQQHLIAGKWEEARDDV